jgi:hypothetical protein
VGSQRTDSSDRGHRRGGHDRRRVDRTRSGLQARAEPDEVRRQQAPEGADQAEGVEVRRGGGRTRSARRQGYGDLGNVQTLGTTATTVFEKAVSGTIADVHSGRRILVTPGGAEIIVLPSSSKLGRQVTKVTSAIIKIAKGSGSPEGSIKTTEVHRVEIIKPAKVSDIKTGDEVLAGGRAKDTKTFNTIEVIVLPAGSGFAN